MSIDTSPKRLRELAASLWVTATSDDRVVAHHILLALADEKEAAGCSSFCVPLPKINEEDRQFLHDNPNTNDVVQFVRQYAQACAKAARDAAFDECEQIIDSMVDVRAMYLGDPFEHGLSFAATQIRAAKEGTT